MLFEHTQAFDETLITKTGMDDEFDHIFASIGWDNFWFILDKGGRLPTMELLCSLKSTLWASHLEYSIKIIFFNG